MKPEVYWHTSKVEKSDRQKIKQHKSSCLWFTGLSGSGKSTLANAVEKKLCEKKIHTYLLDGDNVRHGLNKDLGFSGQDREENIRRLGEVVRLFVDAGIVVLTAFISPYYKDRDMARSLLEEGEFIEIYVKCDLAICEKRDPKGLYKKARKGNIPNFTGISAPYEEPLNPEITIDTGQEVSLEEQVETIIQYLKTHCKIER